MQFNNKTQGNYRIKRDCSIGTEDWSVICSQEFETIFRNADRKAFRDLVILYKNYNNLSTKELRIELIKVNILSKDEIQDNYDSIERDLININDQQELDKYCKKINIEYDSVFYEELFEKNLRRSEFNKTIAWYAIQYFSDINECKIQAYKELDIKLKKCKQPALIIEEVDRLANEILNASKKVLLESISISIKNINLVNEKKNKNIIFKDKDYLFLDRNLDTIINIPAQIYEILISYRSLDNLHKESIKKLIDQQRIKYLKISEFFNDVSYLNLFNDVFRWKNEKEWNDIDINKDTFYQKTKSIFFHYFSFIVSMSSDEWEVFFNLLLVEKNNLDNYEYMKRKCKLGNIINQLLNEQELIK